MFDFFYKNYKKVLIPVILVVFLFAAFYGFPNSPSPWLDEGINMGIVKTWVESGIYSFRLSPDSVVLERPWLITNNYPVLAPIAVMFSLFGIGMWQIKVVMIIFIISFLLLSFVFVKKNYSGKAAYLSLALLVSFLPLYGNGLTGGNGELPGITFLLASFIFINSKKNWKVLISGFFIGLSVVTKPLFLPVLLILAIEELYFAFIAGKLFWRRWLLLFAGMLLPLAVWFKTLFPHDLSFVYLKKTLEYYSNSQITDKGIFKLNLIKFFTESTPLHFTLLFLFYCFFRFKGRIGKIKREEIILLLFVFVDIIYFLRSPGWYRYFFPAHLIMLILSGPAFLYCKKYFRVRILDKKVFICVFMVLFAVQTVHLIKNRGDILYYNRTPAEFANYLNKHIEKNKVLFMVDQAAIGFLVTHKNTYHNFRINSHLRVGENLFKNRPYPDYIAAINPQENEFLKNYTVELRENFKEIYRKGKHILYMVKD